MHEIPVARPFILLYKHSYERDLYGDLLYELSKSAIVWYMTISYA